MVLAKKLPVSSKPAPIALGLAALVCDHVEASSLRSTSDIPVRDAKDAFDHILLGAPDLDVGIRG
jgi:hypothetical protein